MKRRALLWLAAATSLAILFGCARRPAPTATASRPVEAPPVFFDHSLFDRIVRTYVRDGRVDYQRLKAADEDTLARYLRSLAGTDSRRLAGPDDELAFWLNAYNAFVIAGVLEHYPDIKSVMDFADFFKERRWEAAGGRHSLDGIENEIIRPTFKDPRIHFILVCAAESCPPLQARAMNPQTLQAQLDTATRTAVNDPKYVEIDSKSRRLRLTRIMSWYEQDFIEKDGSLEAFLLRYLEEPARSRLEDGEHTIEFMDYDWALNDARPPTTR